MAKKLYLIDTSVILDDPQNIIYLSDGAKNILFISDIVLEELDKKKTSNEVGFLAREFFRNVSNESEIPSNQSAKQSAESSIHSRLSGLSLQCKNGDFMREIYYENASVRIPLIVIYRQHYQAKNLEYGLNDARIAEIAKDYNLILLTNDISLKIRSIAKGIKAQSLFRDRVENPNDIDFWHKFLLHKDDQPQKLTKLKAFKALSQWSLIQIDEQDNTDSSLYLTGKKHFGLKVDSAFERLELDSIIKEANLYIAPMNLEQKMMFCLLTHKKISPQSLRARQALAKRLWHFKLESTLSNRAQSMVSFILETPLQQATKKQSLDSARAMKTKNLAILCIRFIVRLILLSILCRALRSKIASSIVAMSIQSTKKTPQSIFSKSIIFRLLILRMQGASQFARNL